MWGCWGVVVTLDTAHALCYITRMYSSREDLLVKQVNEAVTIEKLVIPIVRRAGFNTEDINSVEEEYEIKTEDGSIFIDRAIKNARGEVVCGIQAKKVGNTYFLSKDVNKTIPAIVMRDIAYGIFTDGIEWRIFEGRKHMKTVNLLGSNSKVGEEYLVALLTDMSGKQKCS